MDIKYNILYEIDQIVNGGNYGQERAAGRIKEAGGIPGTV